MATFHLEPVSSIANQCSFLNILHLLMWWHPFGLRMTSVTELDMLHMKFTIQKPLQLT